MASDTPYMDPDAKTEVRVADLLERMTLQEKVGQLVGMHVGSLIDTQREDKRTTTVADVEEAIRNHNIGSATPFGTGVSKYNNIAVAGRIANRLQHVAIDETRLGIPLLVPVDAIHGHANIEGSTVFPQNLGMASTWNPDLVERAARVTAVEMSATGANQNYSPTADIARDLRWGRTYETYGESSPLVEKLVAAEIRGLQGDNLRDSTSVAATVKHYPASSGPVRGEDTAPVDVSIGTLRRVYLPPFERAIDEDVAALMPAYNAIGNEPAHASKYYLTELLREQLRFEGVTCSDWLGILMLAKHHRISSSLMDSVKLVTDAGLDIASIGGPQHIEALLELVETDEIPEKRIDQSVRRILALKFDLGLFDDPYVTPEIAAKTVGSESNRQVARESARQSVVLLQNRDDILPLDDIDELLVTGPNADSLDNLLGGWTVFGLDSSQGKTVREGLNEVVDPTTTVTYEPGVANDVLLQPEQVAEQAAKADATVVVVGEPWYLHEFGPESVVGSTDIFPKRNQLRLPDEQRELIERVGATDTPTIVVAITGRPLVLTDIIGHADGLLTSFFPGIEGGVAIAEILFGAHFPTGRLPISFPRTMGDLPLRHDWLPHPSPIGDNEHQPSYDPLFEFGFGLSYTEFTFNSLTVSAKSVSEDAGVTVQVTVTNTGSQEGVETVQLFGQHLFSSVLTPVRELLAFSRLRLAPGETGMAEFTLNPTDFTVIRPDGSRVLESGEFKLYVANLSQKLIIE